MEQKRNFTLEQLDAYARSLTTKQTNMLYENRLHKTYKPLNEAFEPDADEYYTIFLNNQTLRENGSNAAKVVMQVVPNKDYIKYKATNYGVYFYVTIKQDYEELLQILAGLGYADAIRSQVEPEFQYCLEPTND
jgi:hypothetical protein